MEHYLVQIITLNDYSPIYNTPQVVNKNNFILDSLNWTKIEGTFTANGSEEYLTIGYFENQTVDTLNNYDDEFNPYYKIASYYYVDGISLIELPCSILIPNVFTPNADNVNDVFRFNLCSKILKTTIFNRWGNLVFETDKQNRSWDGRTTSGINCEDGIYFYCIETEAEKHKGHIQLIR
ncbi:MAG: gliding motility-associated C-terminal domain-containing protein [Bacteroidetes bacterium]|nr:gliding motility-associated C-terminal domain-containing protein [Bacteroidota bacterium]